MRPIWMTIRCFLPSCAILALTLWAEPARAQIREVVVGVTTTCPYENAIEGSCWSGAYWALTQLEGIKSVEKSANGYTCTARVYLKDNGFPDPDKWASQFKEKVDQAYIFRGVEVTVVGTVEGIDNALVLRVPGVDKPIMLLPLAHKLQWNSKKGAARQPEPGEQNAYKQFLAIQKGSTEKELKVELTGPLRRSEKDLVLEVREFFLASPEATLRQQD